MTPNNYTHVPIRELRAFPIRQNKNLRVLDYRLTNPPGMTGSERPRTHGHGAVLVGGDYVMNVCLTRERGQWFLETELLAYDQVAARREGFEPSPSLLADVYRAMQRRQIAAQARQYGRTGGRN